MSWWRYRALQTAKLHHILAGILERKTCQVRRHLKNVPKPLKWFGTPRGMVTETQGYKSKISFKPCFSLSTCKSLFFLKLFKIFHFVPFVHFSVHTSNLYNERNGKYDYSSTQNSDPDWYYNYVPLNVWILGLWHFMSFQSHENDFRPFWRQGCSSEFNI